MRGERLLISLREVLNPEQILSCYSLIKKDINLWKEDLQPESNKDESYEIIDEILRDQIVEISESVFDHDTSEVATVLNLTDQYLTLLSRGDLWCVVRFGTICTI